MNKLISPMFDYNVKTQHVDYSTT
uniref:Uncharacterized protein n=1 Tax=Arundo donax TaxID=35708 RepID=A0A0A9BHP0_ARUDO